MTIIELCPKDLYSLFGSQLLRISTQIVSTRLSYSVQYSLLHNSLAQLSLLWWRTNTSYDTRLVDTGVRVLSTALEPWQTTQVAHADACACPCVPPELDEHSIFSILVESISSFCRPRLFIPLLACSIRRQARSQIMSRRHTRGIPLLTVQ